LDQTYNQFPSLHISLGYLCWRALHERLNLVFKILLFVWFGLIAASTLLVYQHHAIDLIGGAIVVVIVHLFIPHNGRGWITLPFVSPRHLHLAFRFLVGAIFFTILAFNVPVFWPLFAWIAMSLLLVSGSYALGRNNFLTKTQAGYGLITWALFAPYLVGCQLNWRFWRPKVSSYSAVKKDVFVGAKPRPKDVEQLKAENIYTIIDLAPELSPSRSTDMDYHHYPLLDITIPDPDRLLKIAEQIEAARKKGTVFVHCALGMSRSILASAAWLMTRGHSKEEALAMIDKTRPERSHRPYMMIALDLFENRLRQQLKEGTNE
ncbi:MAG: dual specificity protein phosphatase family protein, partial [Sneathiellales bacterium]|nr:dual specificity protein phosphatase family protein [Sneathiellales bacterium]